MLFNIMLYIILAYILLFAALFNAIKKYKKYLNDNFVITDFYDFTCI